MDDQKIECLWCGVKRESRCADQETAIDICGYRLIDQLAKARARLEAVEKRAEAARWNVDEDGNLVRLCRGDHDKYENCSDHEELFVPIDRAERAEAALRHVNRMIDEALPKFNWGASFLDANAVTLLNEAPIEVKRVLNEIEKGSKT